MRVLRFLGFPIKNFSSLEHMVLSHCENLNANGHYAECVYDGIWNQDAADQATEFAKRTRIHFDFPFPLGFSPVKRLKYFVKALRLIRSGNFDVVDAYFEPSSRVLNVVARFCPKAVFVNTMGNPLHQRSRFAPIRRLKRWYAIYIRRNFDGIVAVSEFVRDDLIKTGLAPEKMTVIWNCVDVEKFRPRSERVHRDDRLNIVFTGRLVEQKNLDVLIRAAKILADRGSGADFKVIIYGEGILRPNLEALISELGLDNIVRMPGHCDDVVGVLANETDIYCHPSIYEGLSASLLEAMASECPIVASSIPSNMEVIRDGETGLLFDTSSPDELAAAITRLSGDLTLRERLAKNARSLVEAEFTIEKLISRTNQFYEELLRKKKLG